MKSVFIVTHGETYCPPNPHMSVTGSNQVRALRPLLPENPPLVICGTGNRHLDMFPLLGLRYAEIWYTSLVGGPESLEKIEGKNMVVLAGGASIPFESYVTTEHSAPALMNLLDNTPNNSIVCAGWPCLAMLGKTNARPATVYRVSFEGRPNLSNMEIQEVKA